MSGLVVCGSIFAVVWMWVIVTVHAWYMMCFWGELAHRIESQVILTFRIDQLSARVGCVTWELNLLYSSHLVFLLKSVLDKLHYQNSSAITSVNGKMNSSELCTSYQTPCYEDNSVYTKVKVVLVWLICQTLSSSYSSTQSSTWAGVKPFVVQRSITADILTTLLSPANSLTKA